MNIRSLTLVLTAVGALALVACKSETGSVGGGGTGGTGGAPACGATCVEALDFGCITSGSASESEFEAVLSCATSSCASECATFVIGGASDAACGSCLQASCSTEFTACSNAI